MHIKGHDWYVNRYLMNIVMIGFSGDITETDKEHRLHRLLTAVLSDRLCKEGTPRVLKEYRIPLETEVEEMCSLGRGIREEAWEEAWEKSKKEGWKKIVFRMRSLGWPDDQIALALGLGVEEVGEIAAEKCVAVG